MQKIFNKIYKAIKLYNLIEAGDKIAVGSSGGKDSAVLLKALSHYQKFINKNIEIISISIDMGFGNEKELRQLDFFCKQLNIKHIIKYTDIAKIIFEIRKEKNPCSLCARIRSGTMHDLVKSLGCNKLALGHHMDDVIETFMLNLFNESRISTFSPFTYLSRRDLIIIRPMVYVYEQEIKRVIHKIGTQVIENPCPNDKTSHRAMIKGLLNSLEKKNKGIKERIFGAICRNNIAGFKTQNLNEE